MLKNRIAYVVVLISLVLLIYLYEDTLTYAALYTVIILPILSFCLTFLLKKQFVAKEFLSQNEIVKGQNVRYNFIVKNNSILPCTFVRVRFKANSFAIKTDAHDKYISIAPFKSQEIVFNLNAVYRGVFEVGILNIILYDFLGLFKFEQKYNKALTLIVSPDIVSISHLPLSITSHGMDNIRNLLQEEDYSTISDLRKYHPTDGYKKIHWKATAKKNELISKNFENTKRNSISLVIDNSKIHGNKEYALALEDSIMQACTSCLYYARQRMFDCTIHYFNKTDGAKKANGSFESLYALASSEVFFDIDTDFSIFLSNFSKTHIDTENIIIFTQSISDSVYSTLQFLNVFGNNIMFFYFDSPDDEANLRISHLMGLNIYCINFTNFKKQ